MGVLERKAIEAAKAEILEQISTNQSMRIKSIQNGIVQNAGGSTVYANSVDIATVDSTKCLVILGGTYKTNDGQVVGGASYNLTDTSLSIFFASAGSAGVYTVPYCIVEFA